MNADLLISLVLDESADKYRRTIWHRQTLGFIKPNGKVFSRMRGEGTHIRPSGYVHEDLESELGYKPGSSPTPIQHGHVRFLMCPKNNSMNIEVHRDLPEARKLAADFVEKHGMGMNVLLQLRKDGVNPNSKNLDEILPDTYRSKAGSEHKEVFRALRGDAPRIKTQMAQFRELPEPSY